MEPIESVRARMEELYPTIVEVMPEKLFNLFVGPFLKFVLEERGQWSLGPISSCLSTLKDELGIRFMDSMIEFSETSRDLEFHIRKWIDIAIAVLERNAENIRNGEKP